jgi:hypothetical protein
LSKNHYNLLTQKTEGILISLSIQHTLQLNYDGKTYNNFRKLSMRRLSAGIISISIFMMTTICFSNNNKAKLIFVCSEDNDLYSAIIESHGEYQRILSANKAVEMAEPGSGILILADHYPNKKVEFPEKKFKQIREKKLRIYIEFPENLPDLKIRSVQKIEWERCVVSSDVFGKSLQKMRILMIHDCHYVKMDAEDPYLVVAKVAGFDTAVYGLENTETHPILFELSDATILVSTTKLSHFITGRYLPKDAWMSIWRFIFRWLQPNGTVPDLNWNETVRPSFNKNEQLTRKNRAQAVKRGVDWFYNSGLLAVSTGNEKGRIGNVVSNKLDYGRNGIYECFRSKINYNGSQPIVKTLRADCASESAMALAFRSFITDDQRENTTASNLLDFVYFNSRLQQGPRAYADSSSFGFIDWFTREDDNKGVYYSDDNARVILSTLTAAAALKTNRWDEGALKAILANFRSTGPAGFKPRRLEEANMQKLGWKHYQNNEYTHFAPHYQSWIWATFLWLYDKTKYKPLLERSKTGIENMMKAYPKEWHWTNGLQQERARMVLPLAWLLRVENTAEHRKWLSQMVDDLLSFQDESGAIREDLGDVGYGKYAPPKSNAAYGTNEAPLIQNNGDPIADMLYTSNFAFFSLMEAAAVTGENRIIKAVNKLADFMVRIQVRSEKHPELNGAWYRAFDYNRWEYWGSNADAGWGVWSTESGWTQGWITTMLMMHKLNTNVWDFTANSQIVNAFNKYKDRMLPK